MKRVTYNLFFLMVPVRRFLLPCACILTICCGGADGLEITSRISPWNSERPLRKSTSYIILHTTEAACEGSLKKLQRNGEAHYCINTAGTVYRIMSEEKLALHAGRSMWDGRHDIDYYSIGIEVGGYYNRDITPAQYKSLSELLDILCKKYKVPSERVLTHSMVAYGAPNAWHRKSHRGRKRCGMLFARDSVRQKLGLQNKPAYDPDVKAGRLVVGDPYLAQVLYGKSDEQERAVVRYTSPDANVISLTRSAWDIARDRYKSSDVVYHFPDGKQRRGNEIRNWKKIPLGTRVVCTSSGENGENGQNKEEVAEVEAEDILEIGVDGDNAMEIAGEEYKSKTTIYFRPDGQVKLGNQLKEDELASLPEKTMVLVGYIYGGRITPKRSAFDICGKAWNFPSTYYRLPDGTLVSGNKLKESQIPRNAIVFFRD